MGTRDNRIDAYIAKSAPFARPILQHLRTVVHKGCPDVQETMKWSFPHYDYHGIICNMAAFKEHCTFGFWKASLMKDPRRILERRSRAAMGNFGRITGIADLPARSVLIALVKEAATLNEKGVKRERTKAKPRREMKAPAYFMAALKKNRKAMDTFTGFSPSARREYVEWVTEAKTEETRDKRLSTAMEWMSEGKQRNWRYIRKP